MRHSDDTPLPLPVILIMVFLALTVVGLAFKEHPPSKLDFQQVTEPVLHEIKYGKDRWGNCYAFLTPERPGGQIAMAAVPCNKTDFQGAK